MTKIIYTDMHLIRGIEPIEEWVRKQYWFDDFINWLSTIKLNITIRQWQGELWTTVYINQLDFTRRVLEYIIEKELVKYN